MPFMPSGAGSDPLRYDNNYGGIVSTNGINDQNADFGNGWYNDHVRARKEWCMWKYVTGIREVTTSVAAAAAF